MCLLNFKMFKTNCGDIRKQKNFGWPKTNFDLEWYAN